VALFFGLVITVHLVIGVGEAAEWRCFANGLALRFMDVVDAEGLSQAVGVGVVAEHDLVSVRLSCCGEGERLGGDLGGEEHLVCCWFVD